MINLFAGFDEREAVGYHTFCASVIARSSEPVAITPLNLNNFKKFYSESHNDGTNSFAYSRFLIPMLMGYKGWAIFADGSDMVCLDDIAKLWGLRDASKAVQVVQHSYETKHHRKYIGTKMEAANEDYPRKNWSSLMLINCANPSWGLITPLALSTMAGSYLHRFQFIQPQHIGKLPIEWNWLADEYGDNEAAKIVHWTAGIPAFKHYENAPMANNWRTEHLKVINATD
jgi:lipopolysaccharide biosynthesis glycosyltransferase